MSDFDPTPHRFVGSDSRGICQRCGLSGWQSIHQPKSPERNRMKKTGVILAVDPMSKETVEQVMDILTQRFPGVQFAVCAGGRDSVVFEYEEPE